MRLAAIDLGTNTFHLIIAEQNIAELQLIYKTNVPVKLGEDITLDNCIIPAAFDRGIACLKNFKATIDQYEIDQVKAVATSGVRSAKNGLKFVEQVKEETGIEIEVIDGDEEAQYIYEAVKLSGAITGKSLIMDIGGGSTEFILCDEENLIWKKSYNIGAARLMQKFFKSDPINEMDRQSIQSHLDEELKAMKVICEEFAPSTLIGSAGAFETYVEMIDPSIDLNNTSAVVIPFPDYQKLAERLILSNHKERVEMKHLIPLRVDMIVMASILTNYVLHELQIKELMLSTFDLKMGVLQSLRD